MLEIRRQLAIAAALACFATTASAQQAKEEPGWAKGRPAKNESAMRMAPVWRVI